MLPLYLTHINSNTHRKRNDHQQCPLTILPTKYQVMPNLDLVTILPAKLLQDLILAYLCISLLHLAQFPLNCHEINIFIA